MERKIEVSFFEEFLSPEGMDSESPTVRILAEGEKRVSRVTQLQGGDVERVFQLICVVLREGILTTDFSDYTDGGRLKG